MYERREPRAHGRCDDGGGNGGDGERHDDRVETDGTDEPQQRRQCEDYAQESCCRCGFVLVRVLVVAVVVSGSVFVVVIVIVVVGFAVAAVVFVWQWLQSLYSWSSGSGGGGGGGGVVLLLQNPCIQGFVRRPPLAQNGMFTLFRCFTEACEDYDGNPLPEQMYILHLGCAYCALHASSQNACPEVGP